MYWPVQHEAILIHLTGDIMFLFWSINFCGPVVQQTLLKKLVKTQNIFLACLCLIRIGMIAIWVNLKDFFLCFQVYDYYFEKWSKITSYIFFFDIFLVILLFNLSAFYVILCCYANSNASLFD